MTLQLDHDCFAIVYQDMSMQICRVIGIFKTMEEAQTWLDQQEESMEIPTILEIETA